MIVQIYEIQDPWQAERCIKAGAGHIGSVLLSQEHWRLPSVKEVMKASKGTKVKNSLLPLFTDLATLARCLDYYGPHYVHLCNSLTDHLGRPVHLEETARFQQTVKEKFPQINIMRTIPIPGPGMGKGFPFVEIARALEPVSDLFLIDTWRREETVEGFIGITGSPADWEISRELVCESEIPVILAGGLSPENVFEALVKVCPYGADTCTHTNKVGQDGTVIRFQKDFQRVEEFVNEVRRAEKVIRDGLKALKEP
jgi:phosphoribosylanthranilate isomerase